MPPQNNIPPDMDALIAWLKEQALEAHNKAYDSYCESDHYSSKYYLAEQNAFNRVIAKIENSRANQRPHVPQGWDEV